MTGMGSGVAATWRMKLGNATHPAYLPRPETLQQCGVLSATPGSLPGMDFGETLRRCGKFPGPSHTHRSVYWDPQPDAFLALHGFLSHSYTVKSTSKTNSDVI